MRLSYKFSLSFISAMLVLSTTSAVIINVVLDGMESRELPSLLAIGRIARMGRTMQAETLEYVATLEDETLEEQEEGSRDMLDALDDLLSNQADPDPSLLALGEAVRELNRVALATTATANRQHEALTMLEDLTIDSERLQKFHELVVGPLALGDEPTEAEPDRSVVIARYNDFVRAHSTLVMTLMSSALENEAIEKDELTNLHQAVQRAQRGLARVIGLSAIPDDARLEQLDLLVAIVIRVTSTVAVVGAELDEQLEQLEDAEHSFSSGVDEAMTHIHSSLREGVADGRDMILLLEGIILALGLLWVVVFSRALSRGLYELKVATERMVEGDLTARADVRTGDELAVLAGHFNTLAQQLNVALGDDLSARITELEQTEVELRSAKDQALRAQHAAEQADRSKSEFLANMSHELRTPLNAIVGMSGLLAETTLDDEQGEFNESVRFSADRLLELINDILDFSKIEAGQLELEHQVFDIHECVESALDLVSVRASEKDLELVYLSDDDVPPALVGDVTRLRQILVNLLSNAVKFTESGEVVVTVECGETSCKAREDGTFDVVISVRDTGIGIPVERQAVLFDKFTQADASTTRKYGGSGLGLAICKALTDAMGGSISVSSEPKRGSKFTAVVQMRRGEEPAPRPHRSSEQPQLRGKTALIVDDNETNRVLLIRQVSAWGIRPMAFATGREALATLQTGETFDIALLDYSMPGMDGVELARKIRALPDRPSAPLILLASAGRSVVSGEDSALFAMRFTKPIKVSALYDCILEVLLKGSRRRSLTPTFLFDDKMAAERPLRILVAEDNVINQKLVHHILTRLGYRADIANNGREALEALRRQTYDVVLMDILMPEMDGIEATQRIREEFDEATQPWIIAVTANAMPGDRQKILRSGMDDYLAKPIQFNELVARLQRCRGGEAPSTGGRAERRADADAAPILDADAFDSMVQAVSNHDQIREIAKTFVTDTELCLRQGLAAVASGDSDGVVRAVHTIKSTSSVFGLKRLSDLCERVEAEARNPPFAEAASRLDDIEEEFRASLDALRNQLETL